MIKFKRTIKEVVKGGFIPPNTTKEEHDIFKPTDPIEAIYPNKVEEKPKKGRKKKNV